jgi:hypothetical protein
MVRAFLFLVVLIMGGQQAPSASDPSAQVRLRGPQSLKEPSARWDRFLARVIQLEITIRSGSGPERRLVAGPLSWKGLTFDDWAPPAGEASVEVNAKVWDRNAEGIPRSYPVVVGSAKVKASEWGQEIPLRMSLQVSVKEYD